MRQHTAGTSSFATIVDALIDRTAFNKDSCPVIVGRNGYDGFPIRSALSKIASCGATNTKPN